MLEDKIKEYLIEDDNREIDFGNERRAKDIAEIAKEYHLVYMADSIKAFKENAEYQKGMIADAKIIKEADNRIIELEKENAILRADNANLRFDTMYVEAKAKCNLCYEAGASKAYKVITELQESIKRESDINFELAGKLVIRNGRIMDLEQQLLDKDKI